MHEASLAGSVLQLVEAASRRDGFRRVAMLRLEAGQLSGVEPRALRFALEALAPGTCLEGANVEIDEPAGQAWCLDCAATVALERRGDACPRCGGWQLQPTASDGLRVLDLLVHDD